MARRRDRDPLQIDLSADDGELDDGGSADEPEGPAGTAPGWFATRVARPLRDRWRGLPRRLRIGLVGGSAAVVAVAIAGVAVVDARVEAAHAERMAALPGGVADLSESVQETWRVEADGGVLAVLPGGVVVTRDGTDVLGIDVADGSEVWRQELGPALDCGPQPVLPGERHHPVDRVICLHGEGERTVVVLGADGTVLGERDLGPASGPHGQEPDGPPQIGPAPDGAVYVVDHVDEMLPELDPQEAADTLADARAAGTWQDPSLRIEDALTGELRGEATVALRTAHEVARCSAEDGPGGEPVRWLISSVGVTTTATHLSVCDGVSTTLAADGTEVDGFPYPTVDGETVLSTMDGSIVPGAAGEDGFTLPGFVLDPAAVDSADGPWLVGSGGITAYDSAGDELWSSDTPTGMVAVRADGVAVVEGSGAGAVRAVDLATGQVRWTNDELLETAGPVGLGRGAATDGTVALVALSDGRTTTELVALDLDDGVELWRTSHDALNGEIFTVDGHLLGVDHEYMTVDDIEVSEAVLVGLGLTS